MAQPRTDFSYLRRPTNRDAQLPALPRGSRRERPVARLAIVAVLGLFLLAYVLTQRFSRALAPPRRRCSSRT